MNGSKLMSLILVILNFGCNGITQQKPLINTPGCRIADYKMKYVELRQNLSCAKRFVLVNKINKNKIIFTMLKKYDSCIYSFIEMSNVRNEQFIYSPFKPLRNNTIAILSKDFVHVVCTENEKVTYVDSYAFVKPVDGKQEKLNEPNKSKRASPYYNVLMLGLDTISRKRAYYSLKETVGFLNKNAWLDYRGFNKVAENTVPNLMAILVGSFLFENSTCLQDMSACNYKILWHFFQSRGYVTAYGEDSGPNPNTFQHNSGAGFSAPPTNHYMGPLFESTQKFYGCVSCTGRQFSGLQVLNYILDYVATYRTEKYFGFFFISSFSHDPYQAPKYYDKVIMQFFSTLKDLGVYNNTFVIFFSDHGIRYGPVRVAFQSFYDERLPMLFLHAPNEFKKSAEYGNLVLNQHRLISPYDLHLTLWDILRTSTDETLAPKAENCPQCMSLFRLIPDDRTCSDAGISEKWCACFFDTSDSSLAKFGATYSLIKAENYMKTFPLSIPTQLCTKCDELSIKKLLRLHSLVDHNGTTFYVIAFSANPKNTLYEVIIRRSVNYTESTYTYDVIKVQLISQYNGYSGWCTYGTDPISGENISHCICQRISNCT